MSDNALISLDVYGGLTTQTGTDEQFLSLAKSSAFIGRLQLFTKGNAVNRRLVAPGEYGIPEGEYEQIEKPVHENFI